jgi:hypothetical protein
MQEVNQVRGTLATRFYTLLLQPRRRIYLIQDSFCLTGIELLYAPSKLWRHCPGVVDSKYTNRLYAGFGFRPI